MKLSYYDDALADCKQAIKLAPNDKALREHWDRIKKDKQTKAEEQKKVMAKALQGGLYNEKDNVRLEQFFDKLPEFNPANP